jgi:hypothetical protein
VEEEAFFVWRVAPTVIIGRNQVLEAEVNLDYCHRNGVKIVRRKSGGGCVYADRDNIMISYVSRRGDVAEIFCDKNRNIISWNKKNFNKNDNLDKFNADYLKYTEIVKETCQDNDLSADSMVIGTSAIIDTEIDGAVGMNSGIFNNPFIIWGKYRKKLFRYELPISFQFHHTQMDGAHAGRFLANLQKEINGLK